ncbi:hypothetical protein [Flexivirga alba]|uniref:Uncharacterized protein n=1 Tax=Flexivirga alba TaxID=702742 RepID=A0ABW2AFQ3_9MICO
MRPGPLLAEDFFQAVVDLLQADQPELCVGDHVPDQVEGLGSFDPDLDAVTDRPGLNSAVK